MSWKCLLHSGLEKPHFNLGMSPSINLYCIDIVSCEFSTWEALSKVGAHHTLCNCLQEKEYKQELIFSWFGRDAPLLCCVYSLVAFPGCVGSDSFAPWSFCPIAMGVWWERVTPEGMWRRRDSFCGDQTESCTVWAWESCWPSLCLCFNTWKEEVHVFPGETL